MDELVKRLEQITLKHEVACNTITFTMVHKLTPALVIDTAHEALGGTK